MSSIKTVSTAAMLLLGFVGGSAAAARSQSAFIPVGAPIDAPRGFSEMCARQSSLCAPLAANLDRSVVASFDADNTGAIGHDYVGGDRGGGPAMRGLDARARSELRLLKSVNRLVNSAVHPETDMEIFHQEEFWQPSGVSHGAVGDCEDIALEKRIELIKAGFPENRLALAVVYRHEIGLHTILVARTDAGDFILDSRNSFIELWDKPPYIWISIQSMTNEMAWSRVGTS